jgi:galactokinase
LKVSKHTHIQFSLAHKAGQEVDTTTRSQKQRIKATHHEPDYKPNKRTTIQVPMNHPTIVTQSQTKKKQPSAKKKYNLRKQTKQTPPPNHEIP